MARSRKESSDPKLPLRARTTTDFGKIVRAMRVRAGMDQEPAAGLLGVGVRFLGELERGKTTARLGLALQVLDRLGLECWIVPRGWRPGE